MHFKTCFKKLKISPQVIAEEKKGLVSPPACCCTRRSVNAASVCRAMTPETTQHVHIKRFVCPNRTKFDAALLLVVNNKPAKCEEEWKTVSRDIQTADRQKEISCYKVKANKAKERRSPSSSSISII